MWWKYLLVAKAAALEFWVGLFACVKFIDDPIAGALVMTVGSIIGFFTPLAVEFALNEGAKAILWRVRWGRHLLARRERNGEAARKKAGFWEPYIIEYGFWALLVLAFLPIPLGSLIVPFIWLRHRDIRGGLSALFLGVISRAIFWSAVFYLAGNLAQTLFS